MGFQYKELTATEWIEMRSGINDQSVFGDLDYLTCFEKAYRIDKKTIAVFEKEKLCLLISFFEQKKQIVCPNHYFFQFVWEGENLTSWRRLMVFEFLIAELKIRYKHIHLRLPIGINDIRAFEWAGFTYHLKHTYIKKLDDRPYHQNLKRILAKQYSYTFACNINWDEVWYKHESDLKSFMLSSTFISKSISLFKKLQKQQYITSYNIYQGGKLLSSIIALIDRNQKKAYFPLIGKIELSKSGAAAHLYNYAFSQLKKEGILEVDLYGANMKSIARFKHKFEPELESFFEVKYNSGKNAFVEMKGKLKEVVKKIVRKRS